MERKRNKERKKGKPYVCIMEWIASAVEKINGYKMHMNPAYYMKRKQSKSCTHKTKRHNSI